MPPVPVAITYPNLAKHTEPLITKLNPPGAKGLKAYLTDIGTADAVDLFERHFLNNWLDKITVSHAVNCPAVTLNALSKSMRYSNVLAFQKAVEERYKGKAMWKVLKMFSDGTNFMGVTYQNVIHLKELNRHELD